MWRGLPSGGASPQGVAGSTFGRLANRVSSTLAPIACCARLAAPRISQEEAEATAEVFRSLGDPHRVQIVNLIATNGGPVCACDLNEPLGLSQPTVSHHLKKLTEAGLLEREQRGKWAFYSLSTDAVRKLAAVTDLKEACC